MEIRLTESELTNLIRRIVLESNHNEMEENWLRGFGRGMRKFATGHESASSREEKRKKLMDDLDYISELVDERPEDFFMGTKWDRAVEVFMNKMEENNYKGHFTVGFVDIDDPDFEEKLSKKRAPIVVRYERGFSGAENLGSAATAGMSQGHTFGGGSRNTSLG